MSRLRVARNPTMMTTMPNTTERIANRVRGVAAEHRFTQAQIADVLGLSRTSIVERFNARIPFTATEIFDLAAAMRVPVESLYPTCTSAERAA